MVTMYANRPAADTTIIPLDTAASRPPWPPSDLAETLFDEFGSNNELIVAVHPNGRIAVHLHTKTLRARGTADITQRRLQNGARLLVADVAIVGYDLAADRRTAGRVSIGVSYHLTSGGLIGGAEGTACAIGDWTDGPLHFTTSEDGSAHCQPEASHQGALSLVPMMISPHGLDDVSASDPPQNDGIPA